LVLGWSQMVAGQDSIDGKIIANYGRLEGVYVVNLRTEVMATTNASGSFSIAAKVGDTIIFSSIEFKECKAILTADNFSDLNFTVKLNPVIHQLQEVIIKRYDNINAVSLGIVPKGQKTYTEAERKLYTSTDLDPKMSLGGLSGGSISADPILNYLSGRTAMLKKELKIEKKQFDMNLLERMFPTEHFVDTLKIPLEYVKGFEYYVVENDKFTVILNSKNKTSTEFLLGELAVKYKEILSIEK